MNVRDLKVCLSRASFVVSNDTGPRHISAALSVPTIVLLGPMDDRYTDLSEPLHLQDLEKTWPADHAIKRTATKNMNVSQRYSPMKY